MHPGIHRSARFVVTVGWAALIALVVSTAVFSLERIPAGPHSAHAAGASLDAYHGLATWISIYDSRAWADPETAVSDMAGHGVQTIFIQSGNSNSKGVVYNAPTQEVFIRAAHSRGMKVVAWYLPGMSNITSDYARIAAAIGFTTSDGQSFDSFALDIESTKIRSVSARNAALSNLTAMIRGGVGDSYILGAIVPSPVGIAKRTGFWNDFPYSTVAADFDVLLPMGYYTYHGKGAAAAAADVVESVRIIRSQPGGADVPIHFIGGLAAKSTAAEVKSFADAAVSTGCIGASLYSWSGTSAAEWDAIRGVAGH